MAHVPHLLVEDLNSDPAVLGSDQQRHLQKVLRYSIGAPLSYTNGRGLVGTGTWDGAGLVRGEERRVPDRQEVTMAVAVPKAKDRQRLIVEKLGELGVARLVWLSTRHGQVTAPAPARCRMWAIAALEQSRSAFLMDVTTGSLAGFPDATLADSTGGPMGSDIEVLAIGPEGGWHPDELIGRKTVALSDQTLRTETAAIIGGALLRAPRMVT